MRRRLSQLFVFSLPLLLLFLIGQTSIASAAPASQESSGTVTAVTIPPRMNVRSGPATTYRVVGSVSAGTEVTIIGENADGTWARVEIDGFDGPVWLAKRLLAVQAGDAVASSQSVTGTTLILSTVALSVTAPITPTAAISAATTVEKIVEKVVEKVAAVAIDISAGPVAVTTPARMNVRGGPGTEYPIATGVNAGTPARIVGLGPDRQWYQVELTGQSDKLWVFAGLTTLHGSLDGIPQLSEEQIPPRPQPAPAAVAAAPATAAAAPAAAPIARSAALPGIGFGYGVQAHVIHTGQEGLAMDKTREMGFGWMKQQIEWRIFESNPGQYGFGDIGPIVGAANLRGINLLFSVVNAPDWAREPGFDASVGGPPADPQTLANFVGRLAGEYCGSSLKAIEIWNEQNLHYEWGNKPLNPAEYVALLRPSYAAIKAACPSIYVISGALTPAGDNGSFARDDFAYLEGMFQAGVANYADGIGAHPSGYNVPASVVWQNGCAAIQQSGNTFNGACDNPHHSWSFRSTMEGYRNIAVVYGAAHLPIWPTEFGWAAGGAFHPAYAYANDNSYEEQATWTVEAYQMMRGWGWVGPAFLWNLNFRVVANGTEKAQWGIVRNDWSPLPVYSALQGMGK
jgi:uncharacterized protein YgiM (DUF1202 family)